MYQVEQILVPVDFSKYSRGALQFARAMGEPSPRIQLAHIVDKWAPYISQALFPYAALGEDIVEFEHELVVHATNYLQSYFKVDKSLEKQFAAEPIVKYGKQKDVLTELVRSVSCELIVMGAAGEGGLYPHTLGSTAERLLRSVITPTILVRDYDKKQSIKHILVAVDLTPASIDVFAKALGLALQIGASLETVYVLPSPFLYDTNKILSSHIKFDERNMLKRTEDKIDALFERLRQNVDKPYSEADNIDRLMKKRRVLVGDPAHEITRYAYESNADLVVVGSRNPKSKNSRSLGRVAWTVARTTPSHVMVVPPAHTRTLLSDE